MSAVTLLAGAAFLGTGQSAQAQSNQYFDTTNASNLTPGTATWDAGTTPAWANTATPGTAAPVVWVNGNNAFFQTGGVNVANVSGTVQVSNITITAGGNAQGTTIGSAGAGSNLQLGGNITTSGGNTNNTFSVLALTLAGTTHTISAAANTNVFSANIGETAAGNSLIFTGAGNNTLSGANTFSGGVTIGGTGNTGTLNIGSTTALGAGAGAFTLNSGAVFNTNGAAIVLANNNAQQWNGNFTFTGAQNLTFGTGAITLADNTTVTVNGNTLTEGGIIGGGAFALTKAGNNGLTLTGASTTANAGYSGATNVGSGTLTVSGATGSIASSSNTVLTGNGTLATGTNASGRLVLDNAAGNTNRLNDTGSVTISTGADLNLIGNATTNTTETIGTLTLGIGNGTVSVTNGTTARITTLAASGFDRGSNLATGLIRGTNLGASQGTNPNYGRVTLGSLTGLTQVGTTTSNTGVNSGAVKDLTIVPYLIGDTSASGTGSNFLTYDTASGLRVLGANEQTTLAAGTVTGATPENVKGGGVTVAASTLTVNSLLLNTTGTLDGTSTALTVNSGAVATVGNVAVTLGSGFSGITLGNGTVNEGIFNVTGNTTTVATPITVTGGGGLTKAGAGTLVLSAANLYTGATTINQGTLQIGNGTAGNLAANSSAITATVGSILSINLAANDTLANAIVNNGTVSKTLGANVNTLSGNISGTGVVTQNISNGTLALSGSNTYSGATNITAGTLQAVANTGNTTAGVSTALSANSALALNAGATLQLRADASTTFTTAGITANGGTATIDVNNLTAGTGNTLRLNGAFNPVGNASGATPSVLNVTGGSGYSLALGTVTFPQNNFESFNITAAGLTTDALADVGFDFRVAFNGTGNYTNLGGLTKLNAARASTFFVQGTGTYTFNGAATTGGTVRLNADSGTTVLNNGAAFISVFLGSGTLITSASNGTMAAASSTAANLLLGGTNASATQVGNNGGVTFTPSFAASDLDTAQLTVGGQNTSGTNTYSGIITLGATTDTGKSANLVAAAGGTVAFTNTIIKNGTDTTAGVTVNAPYVVNGVSVSPSGTVRLSGANTFGGSTTVNRGTLQLDYSTQNNSKISSTSALVLGGGTVTVTGASGGATTQTVGGLTLNSGASAISVSPAAASPNAVVLNLGAITRNTGSTINFTLPPGTQNNTYGITTSTTNTASGILGGWATVGLNDWATVSGGNVNQFTGYTTYNNVETWPSNANLTDDGSGYDGSFTNSKTINSLRFNSGSNDTTVNVNGSNNLTISSGGILVTNNTGAKYQRINGGGLTTTASDLVIHQNNAGSGHLEIGSSIFGNIGLTKSGVGFAELNGFDATYTGTTTVNAGTLKLTAGATATTAVQVNFGGTLLLGANNRINNAASVALNGGTFSTGGFSEGNVSGGVATAGVGALTLMTSSIIDLGSGASILAFADSSGVTWTGTLSIYNYSGNVGTGGGTDELFFGNSNSGLTPNQVSAITFYSDAGLTSLGGASILANGEVVPVPEPGTVAAGLLALGSLGYSQRRRVRHFLTIPRQMAKAA